MIGKGATPSFFSIANYNYTLTLIYFPNITYRDYTKLNPLFLNPK